MAVPSISVLTVTLNCQETLPALIESLRAQTDKAFRWVVADGGSTDDTASLIRAAIDMDISYVSEPDCGIYDGLNRGLKRVDTDYYLVVGADDILYPNAISDYRKVAAESQADIIAAGIMMGTQKRIPSRWKDPLGGVWSKTTNHSVGTLIRKNLHEKFGVYSTRYIIASDTLFLIKLCKGNARFAFTDALVGYFCDKGVSGLDYLRTIFESTLVRLEAGYPFDKEMLTMIARLIRHYPRMRRHYRR